MSRLKSKLVKKIITAAAVVATACSDAGMPVAPVMDDAPQMAAVSGQMIAAARRATPHASAESVSKMVTPSGAVLSVGGATLTVPAGAVDHPVRITMTVPEGSFLQVHFEPHGLQFDKPVGLSVDLEGATGSSFKLAYFETMTDGMVNALETSDVTVANGVAHGFLRHFSGYIIAM